MIALFINTSSLSITTEQTASKNDEGHKTCPRDKSSKWTLSFVKLLFPDSTVNFQTQQFETRLYDMSVCINYLINAL